MPTRARRIAARDLDGQPVILSFAIAKKLYFCPSCGRPLWVGAEHVLVRYPEGGGDGYHQHWHRDCVAEHLCRQLRDIRPLGVEPRGGAPGPGRRRQATLRRRRERS